MRSSVPPVPGSGALPTCCYMCSSECGLLVRKEEGGDGVTRLFLSGNPANPMNRGGTCRKAQLAETLRLSPERIRTPLRRTGARGEGRFEPCSLEEALWGIEKSGLGQSGIGQSGIGPYWRALREHHGPECLTILFGEKPDHDMAWDFAARFGTPNILDHNSLCDTSRRQGFADLFGPGQERPLPDILRPLPTVGGVREAHDTRFLLLLGENPAEARRFFWEWPAIREARKAGMVLAVADPCRTPTAREADLWLPVRPGSDAALLLFLLRAVLDYAAVHPDDRKVIDRDFIARHTEDFAELDALIRTDRTDPQNGQVFHTLPWAMERTGLDGANLQKLANAVLTLRPFCGMVGMNGVAHQPDGYLATQALGVLLAITGMVDVPGGLLLRDNPPLARPAAHMADRLGERQYLAKDRYGAAPFARHGVVARIPRDITEGITLTSGPRAGHTYRTRALFVIHGNPFLTAPESGRWVEAATERDEHGGYRLESLVVCATTLNETARYADWVLPMAHFLERQGVVVQETPCPCVSLREQAVPCPGEVLSPLALFQCLTRAVFPGEPLPWTLGAATDDAWCDTLLTPILPALRTAARERQAETRTDPRAKNEEQDEIAVRDMRPTALLRALGGTLVRPVRYGKDLEKPVPLMPRSLRDWAARVRGGTDAGRGADPFSYLEEDCSRLVSGRRVFRLISGRSLWHTHTITQSLWPEGSGAPGPVLAIRRKDAEELGFAEGELVRMTNTCGESQSAVLALTDDLAPGVLRGLYGFGRATGEDAAPGIYNMNRLTDASAVDPVTGNALFGSVLVTLEKRDAEAVSGGNRKGMADEAE